MVDREILDLERGQRIAERMVMGVRVEEFYMGEERETRQGWFELHVGGFGTRKGRSTVTMRKALKWATMSSSTLFLTGTVSLNAGNSWPVAMQRADAAQVKWFSRLQRVRSHSYPVFSIQPQRRQAPTSSKVAALSSNHDSESVQHVS